MIAAPQSPRGTILAVTGAAFASVLLTRPTANERWDKRMFLDPLQHRFCKEPPVPDVVIFDWTVRSETVRS